MAQKPRRSKSEEAQPASNSKSTRQSLAKPESGVSRLVFNQASTSRTEHSRPPVPESSNSKPSMEFESSLSKSPPPGSPPVFKPASSKAIPSVVDAKLQMRNRKSSQPGSSLSRFEVQSKDVGSLLKERKQSKQYQMLALTNAYKKHEPLKASMPWSSVDSSSISPKAKTAAQTLQKKLGLDEYPKGNTIYSPEDIAKTQKWFDQSKDRVTTAKTRASTDQKYQPMGVDKAKTEARLRRVRSNEANKNLLDVDATNINHAIDAKVAGKLDRDAGLKYAERLSKAATKAGNDNRWNDAARHEQASARAAARTNLRYSAMKETMDDLQHRGKTETNKKPGCEDPDSLQKQKNKAQISKGEHIIAGHWYQQAREMFSGSDSEEDIQVRLGNEK